MKTRVGLVLVGAALLALLGGNALPEPESRAPFALEGNPTYDAHTYVARAFPPGPTRLPVFHFAENALSASALRTAFGREREVAARPAVQAAAGQPPYPGAVAGQAFGLPGAVAQAGGGTIPEGAQLTAVLDQLFAFTLPDGSQPLRELVSADLVRGEQGWRAEGLISELFLAAGSSTPDLERELRTQLTADGDRVQTWTLLGLQDTIQEQVASVMPWLGGAVLLMLLVVGGYFQAWREVVAAAVGLLLLVGALSGLRKLLGLPETQLTSMLPILLLALGVDYAIHSLQRLRELRDASGRTWSRTVRSLAPALLLTTITSAVAFGSSGSSSVADLRDWGLLAAGGIALAYAVMGWVVPALRVVLGGAQGPGEGGVVDDVPLRAPFAARHPKLCLGLGVLLVAAAGARASALTSGFDLQDFLAADVPYVQAVNRVAAAFPNSGEPATVLLEGAVDLQRAEAFAAELREEGLARPSELEHLLRELRAGESSTPHVLRTDGEVTAVAVPVHVHRAGEWTSLGRAHAALSAAAEQLTSEHGGPSPKVTVTGAPFLRYAYVNALTDAVRDGILFTLALCFAIACVAFRSLKWAAVALLPVVAVCLCLQAIMALAGLRLNLVTVQVVALAIGLGSDYMLHYVQRFRELRRERPDVGAEEVLASTHADTGRAVQGSAVSTLIGFALLAAAPMPLFATFGRIQAVMVGLSLIAVSWLLPALIVLAAGRRPKAQPAPAPAPHCEEALCA